MDLQAFAEITGQLWVLTLPPGYGRRYPWMQQNGRMECFTEQTLAEQALNAVRGQQKTAAELTYYQDKEAVQAFFTQCMHDGIQVFHLNNGSPEMKELWLRDLAPSWHEATLQEEANRAARQLLIRCRQYTSQYMALSPEEQHSPGGLSLANIMLTMRFNAYRELYRGILYVLISEMEDGLDYYSLPALQKAKAWLAAENAKKDGFGPAALIHGRNRGGEIIKSPQELYYVNKAGEEGMPARGEVCVFTDYGEAVKGRDLFRNAGKPCSVAAVTMPEILDRAAMCAGLMIDLNSISYIVEKAQFGELTSYGQLDGGIIVNVKQSEDPAPDADHPEKEKEAQNSEGGADK